MLQKEKRNVKYFLKTTRSGFVPTIGKVFVRAFLALLHSDQNDIPGRKQIRVEGQTCSGKSTSGRNGRERRLRGAR